MTESTVEASLLANLIPKLEAEGYEVYVHPSKTLLPSFMRSYIPDLIAFGTPKNLAIEIKRPSDAAKESLAHISALFDGQKEWDFRIYWATPNSAVGAIKRQSSESIGSIISEVRALAQATHYRPALLLCWAAFEAAGRAVVERRLAKPQTPLRLVEVLASEGYLTPSEADQLRLLAEKRNRLVHGEIDIVITKEEIDNFVEILETLISMASQLDH